MYTRSRDSTSQARLPSHFVTATATDPQGNTSEFSSPVAILV